MTCRSRRLRSCSPPPAASLEGLDNEHAAAAAGAETDRHRSRKRFGLACILPLGCWSRQGEQRAYRGEVIRAGAAGQKPVMADAVEALGQHMDQEAADELGRLKCDGLVAARSLDAVVLVCKGDRFFLSAAIKRRFEIATRCV